MVLAPNDLFSWNNKYNKYNEYNVTVTFTYFFLSYAHQLTLCMLASWSHEGVVFLDFLPSSHSITSSPFPCLGSTDAPCSRFGDPVPPSPRWRPHSQGPRTLPYRDPEHQQTECPKLSSKCLGMVGPGDLVGFREYPPSQTPSPCQAIEISALVWVSEDLRILPATILGFWKFHFSVFLNGIRSASTFTVQVQMLWDLTVFLAIKSCIICNCYRVKHLKISSTVPGLSVMTLHECPRAL